MPKLSASAPLLHPGAQVVNSTFGAWCEVGEGARLRIGQAAIGQASRDLREGLAAAQAA